MNKTLCCHRHRIYSIGAEDFYRDTRVVVDTEEVQKMVQDDVNRDGLKAAAATSAFRFPEFQ
jgi:hypothetical protein